MGSGDHASEGTGRAVAFSWVEAALFLAQDFSEEEIFTYGLEHAVPP